MFHNYNLSILALGLSTISTLALAAGPAAVNLGTAANFAIVAKSGVSTVPDSVITGNIGLSPAAGTFLTGFSLQKTSTVFATSTQVTGMLFAADFTSPTPSVLTTAVLDMQTAQVDAAGRPNPDSFNLGAGTIGGLTLAPGLYKWTSGLVIAANLIISGAATDTWIFQISGTLSLAAAKSIILAGGARTQNIVWVVSGAVTLGTTSHFEGILIASTSVALTTGATMNGRILSQTAVALQKATVVQPVV
ncbi:ice-binding protein [Infundibulicybe gibba]|nr:ice-binding protein [Infundibulicybe gibba]